MGTLETLPGLIHERGLRPPATIIVGDVVRLREKLSWYLEAAALRPICRCNPSPRSGRRVSLASEGLGAKVIELPAIEIQPALDYGPLDRALASMKSWDWIVFTSANGVASFWIVWIARLAICALSAVSSICAIGPQRAACSRAFTEELHVLAGQYVR